MFWKSKTHVPWSEVGAQWGSHVVQDADALSEKLKGFVESLKESGVPEVSSHRWRYEFCIWNMFWVWYVANSPRLIKSDATKHLLDAYYLKVAEAMVRAGLIDKDARAWEQDISERFMKYKRAFDNPPSGPVLITGTVGWEFAHHLVQDTNPNPKLAMLINVLGSKQLEFITNNIQNLESSYSPK